MPTIRITKQKNFSIISNKHLNDFNLSFKAKGILTYLLSKPDDWTLYVTQLIKSSREGREAVYSGINELVQAGYIIKQQKRNHAGQMAGIEYLVIENPGDKPDTGNPDTGNPDTVKGELLKTDTNNNGFKEKTTTPPSSSSSLLLPEKYNTAVIQALLLKALTAYPESHIKESISYALDNSTGGTPAKFKAYLGKTITNGWGVGYQSEKLNGQKHNVEHFKKMSLGNLKMLASADNVHAIRELSRRSG